MMTDEQKRILRLLTCAIDAYESAHRNLAEVESIMREDTEKLVGQNASQRIKKRNKTLVWYCNAHKNLIEATQRWMSSLFAKLDPHPAPWPKWAKELKAWAASPEFEQALAEDEAEAEARYERDYPSLAPDFKTLHEPFDI
jgi:hypothetical protein